MNHMYWSEGRPLTTATFHTKPTIQIEHLTKVYRKRSEKLTAVDNLTLRVEVGQVFGFLRANDAGKITTIKMICGLIQPTNGTIHLNGHSATDERGQSILWEPAKGF